MIPLLLAILLQSTLQPNIVLQTFVPGTNNLINGSYYNISSFSSIYQLTNNGTGGLEELFLMLVLFFVIGGGSTIVGRFNPINSFFGASIIMVVISTLAQSAFRASGGVIAAFLPLLFVGLAILFALVALLGNFLSPYG